MEDQTTKPLISQSKSAILRSRRSGRSDSAAAGTVGDLLQNQQTPVRSSTEILASDPNPNVTAHADVINLDISPDNVPLATGAEISVTVAATENNIAAGVVGGVAGAAPAQRRMRNLRPDTVTDIFCVFLMGLVAYYFLWAELPAKTEMASVSKVCDCKEYRDAVRAIIEERTREAKIKRDAIIKEFEVYVEDIVKKKIEKHAADGLERVDYALSSAGAFVVEHSPSYPLKGGNWSDDIDDNALKMLSPSFGQPGHCFPLNGSKGYVTVRLSAIIKPESVTLEHVDKSVEDDRSSAPKDGHVLGWFQGHDTSSFVSKKTSYLTKFTYNLDEPNNIQTFNVEPLARSRVIDTIFLLFDSNHGASFTCIYRLRIHGYRHIIESSLEA